MEFFEPAPYHHQHPHYHHDQMSHYNDPHHTYAMAQSAPMIALPNVAKANETKPRLGKDEVDILEREFKKNPKPTTQTKRQFAEEMGVDLARINVSVDGGTGGARSLTVVELVPESTCEEEAREEAGGL